MAEERIINEETGGEKGRKDRRYELLPWEQLGQVAELYAFGAKKYTEHNWRRGYRWSLSIGALFRHAEEWIEGNEIDEETGCDHMTAVVFHALALLYFKEHHQRLDDRPNKIKEQSRAWHEQHPSTEV